jgi:hypothetical protein
VARGVADAIVVLGVKVKPLRGRFANLDPLRAPMAFARHVVLVSEAAKRPPSRTKTTWTAIATPTRCSHSEGAEAKRRTGAAG